MIGSEMCKRICQMSTESLETIIFVGKKNMKEKNINVHYFIKYEEYHERQKYSLIHPRSVLEMLSEENRMSKLLLDVML